MNIDVTSCKAQLTFSQVFYYLLALKPSSGSEIRLPSNLNLRRCDQSRQEMHEAGSSRGQLPEEMRASLSAFLALKI